MTISDEHLKPDRGPAAAALDFEALGSTWYRQLVATANEQRWTAEPTQEALSAAAAEATTRLLQDSYDTTAVQRLGASLASALGADTLAASIQTLTSFWLRNVPANANGRVIERLPDFLHDLTTGFLAGHRNTAVPGPSDGSHEGEPKTIVEALRINAERLQILHDVESAILNAASPEDIASTALTHIFRILDLHSANVSLFEKGHSQLQVLAALKTSTQPGTRFRIADSGALARLRQGLPLVLDDLAQVPSASHGMRILARYGSRGLIVVPLFAQGALIGVMSLTSSHQNAFGSQEIEIASQVANSVSIAIHNAQLLETEQQARTEAETMRAVAASLSSSLDQTELLNLVLEQLALVVPYDSAAILLNDHGALDIAATGGRSATLLVENSTRIDPPLANLQWVLKNRQPLIIDDTTTNDDWVWFPTREYIRCWMGVPMLIKGAVRGILTLDKAEPGYYDTDSIRLAEAFVSQAAVALENARLYQQVQANAAHLRRHVVERTRQLKALYDISAAASRHLDLQHLLDEVLDRVLGEFGCSAAAVLVLDENQKRLTLLAEQNLSRPQAALLQDVAVEKIRLPHILSRSQPSIIPDTSQPGPILAEEIAAICRCFAAAPLRAKGEAFGLLLMLSDDFHEFSADEVALLGSIADQVGILVENNNLRHESEQLAVLHERERLARDLHDSATQSLYSLSLFSSAARERVQVGDVTEAMQYLDEVEQTATQIQRELRLLLHELADLDALDGGLVGAIHKRLRFVEGRSGIVATLEAPDDLELPAPVRRELYMVANEALNNALKHGRPQNVRVVMSLDGRRLTMTISDDGDGFELDSSQSRSGMGLNNIRQRVHRLGGSCRVESALGQGSTVTIVLPLGLDSQGKPKKENHD